MLVLRIRIVPNGSSGSCSQWKWMLKFSSACSALLLASGALFNPVSAYPTDEWFDVLIDRMCELTAEKGRVAAVGTEAVDYVLNQGFATELTTYAMSVGDQGFGEAIAKGLLASCPDLYP